LAGAMQAGYLAVADESVRAACEAKGIAPESPRAGEEWGTPWFVVRQLRLVREALRGLKANGNTPVGPVRRTIDGRLAVQVFPAGPIDGMLFKGVTVECHLQRGVEPAQLESDRASCYKRGAQPGRVALVLGGGNINAIPSMDVITRMFNEGTVCVLKMNPVNAYLGPYLERAFAEPIRQNFLAIVYGGAEEGSYLARHDGIDEIHLTGSDRTYDALVWGPPGPERDARKAQGRRALAKPVTAELGNVSPVIMTPGRYSDKELAYQAEDVASALTYNASFNCNASKVIITARGWPQRDAFLRALETVLAAAGERMAYYPGAKDRWETFAADRRGARSAGSPTDRSLPFVIVPGLDPEGHEPGFRTESFCPVIYETQLDASDPVEFLAKAVGFANEQLWGTLSAGLVVPPAATKNPAVAQAVERAIVDLRYGSVNVNAWSGYTFAFGSPPWGAHPSSSPADIQSGAGWVHNTAMLEGIEKAVLRHPITMMPKPAYFPTHRTADTLTRRITALEEKGSWLKVPGVIAAAMRG
ncbi:MAG TPA: aldehyde dehydrogenase family protein, partial [Gemmatimonadales bacterium]|nr:aldehyde dehydrogenase family protein [Gemmatimonadales bacterium]